jgi:hypothetical protein
MAKRKKGNVTKITRGLDAITEKLKGRRAKKFADEFGKMLVKEMKTRIAAGTSPITGKRFPAYKNPPRYPGTRKPKRPVNLYLTGEMLRALTFRIKEIGEQIVVTIFLKTKKARDKERGHREGAGGQPKRPIIPQGDEVLTRSIHAKARKLLLEKFDIRRR